jgi:hypothetical protein
MKTYRNLKTLYGHMDYIYKIIYLNNLNRIISASADKTLRIWNS